MEVYLDFNAYLNFSRDDFVSLSKLSEFVTHVLSDRNNQTNLSSVNLCFDGEDSDVFVKQNYDACVRSLTISNNCDVEFPLFLFSSRTLKHLSLKKQELSSGRYIIKATSSWELPSLTTMYLHGVILWGYTRIGFFSTCANLKNLTLNKCYTRGFQCLSICLPILSNLTLENVYGSVDVISIVAPQLKNLTIIDFLSKYFQISAPDLVSLLYYSYSYFQASIDDFPFLEKAGICIPVPEDANQVLRLLQRLHNVESLSLNLEIVEFLSSYVELMSNQPSPFVNLKSLRVYPLANLTKVQERHRVRLAAEVKRYLLESSPGATFSMVTHEDKRNMNNTELVQNLITELRVLLEQEKARTETKMAKMLQLGNSRFIERSRITSNVKEIKELLKELPASNRATIQSSFSTLFVAADTITRLYKDVL